MLCKNIGVLNGIEGITELFFVLCVCISHAFFGCPKFQCAYHGRSAFGSEAGLVNLSPNPTMRCMQRFGWFCIPCMFTTPSRHPAEHSHLSGSLLSAVPTHVRIRSGPVSLEEAFELTAVARVADPAWPHGCCLPCPPPSANPTPGQPATAETAGAKRPAEANQPPAPVQAVSGTGVSCFGRRVADHHSRPDSRRQAGKQRITTYLFLSLHGILLWNLHDALRTPHAAGFGRVFNTGWEGLGAGRHAWLEQHTVLRQAWQQMYLAKPRSTSHTSGAANQTGYLRALRQHYSERFGPSCLANHWSYSGLAMLVSPPGHQRPRAGRKAT